ncbi:cora-like Mg2+ transporter protein-domain-containing protein [Podospora aff. communis PSN243]|uniref:Cora-like Mg2+ transporter protein-domain-containing protein n=1 Tax=Podospora aff. communis PSN243 TaxID=3040156 RepID=A0AAV9GA97_9PEZI|nr:cora-like Mg2+ transporter protein-domain-containing protein [Podospora aff. communis PSN243]
MGAVPQPGSGTEIDYAKDPKIFAISPPFPTKYIKLEIRGDECSVSEERDLGSLATGPNELRSAAVGVPDVAQIYIVEMGGTLEETKALVDLLPPYVSGPGFLTKHFQGRGGLSLLRSVESANSFWIHWPRLVRQESDVWEDEERIRVGKFWNLDTYRGRDPSDLVQHHRRHYGWPEYPRRGYDFISKFKTENQSGVYHAAHECVAFHHTSVSGEGGWIGYLFVDPIRHHRVLGVTYGRINDNENIATVTKRECFIDDLRPIERFRDAIREANNSHDIEGRENTPYSIKALITRIAHNDILEVLDSMSKSLDDIELSLHDDSILRDCVAIWRVRLGKWRNTIFHQERVLRLIRKNLEEDRQAPQTESESRLDKDLQTLQGELCEVRLRIDYVFQSLMSAMSILESHKAIEQAEGVSKLTYLAFIFIPPSLVATVFGMNVVEFEDKLTWIAWLLTTACVMLVTYLALYRKEILNQWRHTLQLITSQKAKGFRKLAVLKIESNRLISFLVAAAVLAVIGVGTWRLVLSDLSVGSKIAIGICVVWAPILAIVIIVASAWIPAAGLHGALRKRRRRVETWGR